MSPTLPPTGTGRPSGLLSGTSLPLRWHLLLLVVASLLPMLSLALALILVNSDTRRQQAEAGMMQLTRSLALTIDQDLEATFTTLALASFLGTSHSGNTNGVISPADFDGIAAGLASRYPHWRSLFLADSYGTILRLHHQTGPDSPPIDLQESYLSTIRQTIITGRPKVSNRLVDPGDQSSRIALAYPILHNGQVEAVLGLTMSVNHWLDHFLTLKRAPELIGSLLGSDGRVLLTSRIPIVPNDLRAPDWYIKATSGAESGTLQGPTNSGVVRTLSYQRLRQAEWIFSSSLPTDILHAPIWRGLWIMSGIGLLLITIAILLSLRQARRIVAPINDVIRTASALEEGRPVPPPIRGTICELNDLSERLLVVDSRLRAATEERQQLLVEETRRRQVAELANRAKAAVLATASHDLRQPFQAMRFYHHLIDQHLTVDTARNSLARLGEAIESGEALLNALLDISTLETGNVQPQITDIPLEPLLQAKLGEVQHQANEKNLRLHHWPTNAVVRSDRLLLGRIIGNLLSNAVRYTDQGSVVIACRKRGAQLRIEIRDSGIGIPPDRLNTIFDEFVRIAGATQDHRKGLGIGLAVVKRSSELLGHGLSVQSKPGKGSVFAVTVPLADGQQPNCAMGQEDGGPALANRHLCVLIVTDDARERAILRQLLEEAGHQVQTAADGASALSVITSLANQETALGRLDLLIVDHAPHRGEDGCQLIRLACGRLGHSIPAILLTDEPLATPPAAPDDYAELPPVIAIRHRPVIPTDLTDLVLVLTAGDATSAGP